MKTLHSVIIAVLMSSMAGPVYGGGIEEIEEDLPVTIDSAYPIPYLGREFQSFVRYQRDEDGGNRLEAEVRLEFGFPRNGEIKIALPFQAGERTPDGLGEFRAEFLYNINQETSILPGFSLSLGMEAATGEEGAGVDPFGKVLLTKTLSGDTNTFQQVHFNGAYNINDDVLPGERGYAAEAFVGYSRRIRSDLLFVADVGHRWTKRDRVDVSLIEYGVRWQLTPLVIVTGSAGHGFGDESPDLRLTAGVQIMF